MTRAGFSEETIVEAIKIRPSNFDTSVEALIRLKTEGISEKIVVAMFATNRPSSRDVPVAVKDDGLPEEVGVYAKTANHFRDDSRSKVSASTCLMKPAALGGHSTLIGTLSKFWRSARGPHK